MSNTLVPRNEDGSIDFSTFRHDYAALFYGLESLSKISCQDSESIRLKENLAREIKKKLEQFDSAVKEILSGASAG